MKRRFKEFAFDTFHLVVAFYAAYMLWASAGSLLGQIRSIPSVQDTITTYQVETLDKRVSALESLRLDQRLIKIETILDRMSSDAWQSQATMAGVALLLARTVYVAVLQRKRGQP